MCDGRRRDEKVLDGSEDAFRHPDAVTCVPNAASSR